MKKALFKSKSAMLFTLIIYLRSLFLILPFAYLVNKYFALELVFGDQYARFFTQFLNPKNPFNHLLVIWSSAIPVFAFIAVGITLLLCFAFVYSLRATLKHNKFKEFKVIKDGNSLADIKFILSWLIICWLFLLIAEPSAKYMFAFQYICICFMLTCNCLGFRIERQINE